jgi:hypothetical protein
VTPSNVQTLISEPYRLARCVGAPSPSPVDRNEKMKTSVLSVVLAAFIGAMALSAPALAQTKTVKACEDEWKANKAANQAAKITEKAYVEKCRAGTAAKPAAAAKPEAKPAAAGKKPGARPAATAGSQKTVKACEDEWKANKAANQAAKITEKAYVEKCRAGGSMAKPASAPAPAPASAPAAQAKPAAAPARPMAAPASGKPAGANQYAAEGQAKSRCPTDTVVWANLDSKIFHFAGHSDYGHTKSGAYMCEKDAVGQGMRAAKNEKHP